MPKAIHWFRQDLRLADNPGLCAAVKAGDVLPVFILDDEAAGDWARGGASRWWLHHSLTALNESLGGNLNLYKGAALPILQDLVARFGIEQVHWNRAYEPWRIARDSTVKSTLQAEGVTVESHNGALLWEPWEVNKPDGTPYRVFTPFFRKGCMGAPPPRKPLPKPTGRFCADADALALTALDLLPEIRWDDSLAPHWAIGETGAQAQLDRFLQEGLTGYKSGRDYPAKPHVSRLSPHLHFGEISVNTVWYAAKEHADSNDVSHFLSEIGWREFSYSLLYHNPDLPQKPLQEKFARFEWRQSDADLRAWQEGLTGIPFVDAGMRELWQTGYMHNRVRMVVASFLVKNLRLPWQLGEAWFWDCLVDADLANNAASWQWVAGSGADAAPYFRIFNPVTQGQKFDADGRYTRTYLPELADLPDKWLHRPWEAPQDVLRQAGITLGKTYPAPIVDLKHSREAALKAFNALTE